MADTLSETRGIGTARRSIHADLSESAAAFGGVRALGAGAPSLATVISMLGGT